VHSTTAIHWDDKAEKLTIGDRQGSFPGMLEHRTFRVVSVMDGHGTGIAASPEADVTIEYDGKATSVRVPARRN
jgi:alpha-D-xyloside xylohydrolase